MLLTLDNPNIEVVTLLIDGPKANLYINGNIWQSNPSRRRSEFTSACFCHKMKIKQKLTPKKKKNEKDIANLVLNCS